MTCTCLYNNTAEGASSIHQADARCPVHGEKRMTTNYALSVHLSEGRTAFAPRADMEWLCRYGDVGSIRLQIASVISTLNWMLADTTRASDAIEVLRAMRRGVKADPALRSACERAADDNEKETSA